MSQTFLIEGIRGSGKTVLMTAVANEFKKDNWIVVNLNPSQKLLEDFAGRLSDACAKYPDLSRTGFNVNVAGFGFGIGSSNRDKDPVSVINDLLERLKKAGKKVLITIDEVLPDTNMRIFASQFQIFLREDFPVYLIMTGLFEQIHAIQNDPSLTFLLRTPKIRLEPLSIYQIAAQYGEIFKVAPDKARELAQLTKGYAFAFQALGLLYYEYHDSLPLEDILKKLDEMLDDFVYRKIWSDLSRQDKNIIRAMPERAVKVSEICEKVHMKSGTFSTYRERLLNRGIIEAPQYGYISLLLPRLSVIAQSYQV